jgi:hypothetical protein
MMHDMVKYLMAICMCVCIYIYIYIYTHTVIWPEGSGKNQQIQNTDSKFSHHKICIRNAKMPNVNKNNCAGHSLIIFIYLFTHLFIYLVMYLFILLIIYSFIHSIILAFNYSFIYLFIHSFIYSFIVFILFIYLDIFR